MNSCVHINNIYTGSTTPTYYPSRCKTGVLLVSSLHASFLIQEHRWKASMQNPNVAKHVENVDGGVEAKGQDANRELGVEYMRT